MKNNRMTDIVNEGSRRESCQSRLGDALNVSNEANLSNAFLEIVFHARKVLRIRSPSNMKPFSLFTVQTPADMLFSPCRSSCFFVIHLVILCLYRPEV